MRSDAKAPTAGSTRRQAPGLGRLLRGALASRAARAGADGSGAPAGRSLLALACLAALSLAALLLPAAPAFSAVVSDRPELFSFDGSDTSAGKFVEPGSIAVDESSGAVYVTEASPSQQEPGHHAVSKFNPDGSAANFSALGASSILGTPNGAFSTNQVYVAVDNSGGPNQGRIYVTVREGERLIAFDPDGSFLWEISQLGFFIVDVAVDSSGHPWLYGGGRVREFDSTGDPEQLSSFAVSGSERALDIDASDNFYVSAGSEVRKYVGGVLDSTIDSALTPDLYVDHSVAAGNLFTARSEAGVFKEFDSSGALLGTYGASTLFVARAIAYNPALDRVYVGDERANDVHAYGPEATGTTPDPTIEATTTIGPGAAEFHGTINPQSVPNAYYFEWSNNTAPLPVYRTPLQVLPEDSEAHEVSFKAINLLGNVNTKVRLVGVNTENGLRTASAFDEFKTPKATEPPDVTIGEPSAIGTTTVTINGTVNPHEDSTRWQARLSTDPDCEGSFAQTGLRYLPGGEVNTPQPVEAELKDLLPAQHYCAFLEANNSFNPFGTGTQSEVKEFTTAAIPPSELRTSFAAPRTDTTARINGLVNPEGEADFSYQFEVSEDGVNWTVRPALESSTDSRKQVFVADELTGLEPNTTYHYRLALAENEAGLAGSAGEERTFTTRTSAELVFPQRGIELVNNPNKGNQNVFIEETRMRDPAIAPDGNKLRWTVLGGAPGGHNGTFSAFLAERSPDGWHSRSIPPPAEQQVGGGSLAYVTLAITPDFSRFIFSAQVSSLVEPTAATRVRIDTQQNQEILRSYSWETDADAPGGVDLTDDGAHVLSINRANQQLEDIGNGTPEVVSLMPDGSESTCGLNTQEGASFVGGIQTFTSGGEKAVARNWHGGYHMIDRTDASLVYFEAKPNGECGKPWGLYLRDRDTEETVLVDPGTTQDVAFIAATPNGRQGYFTTLSSCRKYGQTSPFACEVPESADANEGVDIYRWDRDTQESTCLTCVVLDASVQVPVLVSADFSHIYFESTKKLVPGEGAPGGRNIYVLSDGTIRFVTRAAAPGGTSILFSRRAAALSADGDTLAFVAAPGPTADAVTPGAGQLYLYDDRNGSVECISCAQGRETTDEVSSALGEPFALSADGSTIAFRTAEALVSLDVNRSTDVYEWRNGARRLVTNGVSEFPIEFASPLVRGVDADGSNILFSVAQPGLTGFEEDGFANLYVARVGGGFEPPPPPVHCVEDSCQGPLQAAPLADRSASATFAGAGNLRSARKRCGARKLRRGRRCVSKRALARRACRKRKGRAKRRCIARQMRRLNRIQRRQLRRARAQANARRAK